MNHQNLNTGPRIILLLGPSACGKSTFCKYFRALFPNYDQTDDRYLVENYLRRNKLSAIEDPKVWDDIIIQLAKDLDPNKNYIVEFARGHDQNYLKTFCIEPKDVYPRTIDLAVKAMHPQHAESIAIIHVTCDYSSRFKRNTERRNITGQNLPDSVLETVFKEDIFMPHYLDSAKSNCRYGTLNGSIPVVTIDNSATMPNENVREYFTALSKKAMNHLIKCQL